MIKNNNFKTVTCLSCGWVHMGVTKNFITQQVNSFNEYIKTLSPMEFKSYYGGRKAKFDDYLFCFRCDNKYTNFRDAKTGDCPPGCTLNPILNRDEKYSE